MNFDSSYGFLFYHLYYYSDCQYVKGTKQILVAVCIVEFTGLHSSFLVCEYCKIIVYSFSVFFTKLF